MKGSVCDLIGDVCEVEAGQRQQCNRVDCDSVPCVRVQSGEKVKIEHGQIGQECAHCEKKSQERTFKDSRKVAGVLCALANKVESEDPAFLALRVVCRQFAGYRVEMDLLRYLVEIFKLELPYSL